MKSAKILRICEINDVLKTIYENKLIIDLGNLKFSSDITNEKYNNLDVFVHNIVDKELIKIIVRETRDFLKKTINNNLSIDTYTLHSRLRSIWNNNTFIYFENINIKIEMFGTCEILFVDTHTRETIKVCPFGYNNGCCIYNSMTFFLNKYFNFYNITNDEERMKKTLKILLYWIEIKFEDYL